MDDVPGEIYASAIGAMAANKIVIHLCTLLANKGELDRNDVETLRHLHLRVLDVGIETQGADKDARKSIEDIHGLLEKSWEAVFRALPKPDQPNP